MQMGNGSAFQGTWAGGRMHGHGVHQAPDGSEYTGAFQNGCRHGHGERFWPCGRHYVGGWYKDMMQGKGRLSYPSGELYEGQFKAGAFHGRGEHRFPNGDVYVGSFVGGERGGPGTFTDAAEGWVFVGQWLHGRMYGQGKMTFSDGSVYTGDWLDGIREGQGEMRFVDGSVYAGPFKQNKVQGHGRQVFPDGSWFEGQFVDGAFEGHGIFGAIDGTEFEGMWSKGSAAGEGCHRFPGGTTITGIFTQGSASGEGTKTWASGCVYTGNLLQNRIHKYGKLTWPDGRTYVGDFEEDALHGQGTLVWHDRGGVCTYKGEFRKNLFEGEGCLEWSSGAHYEGTFSEGVYHGQGTFFWPHDRGTYRGSWINGEMCGSGTLEVSGKATSHISGNEGVAYAYSGSFRDGEIDGEGGVTFGMGNNAEPDRYEGEFKHSQFMGRGVFSWSSGAVLEGLFEDGYCNRVGRKVYPDGHIYTGEIRYDLEHGKGLVSRPGGLSFVALCRHGQVVKELLDSCAPEFDLVLPPEGLPASTRKSLASAQIDGAADGNCKLPVAPRSRLSIIHERSTRKQLLPVMSEQGQPAEGKTLVVFMNGDRYVGDMRCGRKHGEGMYVYSDLVTYRGQWSQDVLNGVRHPVTEDLLPVEVRPICGNSSVQLSSGQEEVVQELHWSIVRQRSQMANLFTRPTILTMDGNEVPASNFNTGGAELFLPSQGRRKTVFLSNKDDSLETSTNHEDTPWTSEKEKASEKEDEHFLVASTGSLLSPPVHSQRLRADAAPPQQPEDRSLLDEIHVPVLEPLTPNGPPLPMMSTGASDSTIQAALTSHRSVRTLAASGSRSLSLTDW